MAFYTSLKAALAPVIAAAALAVSASGASALDITKIENGQPGTATFLLSGDVQRGDADRLRGHLERLPPRTTVAVILNSGGGDLFEGMRLGTLFHNAKLATFVASGGYCHSACSMAFLGGRDPLSGQPMRIKPSTSKLGFHQFRRSNYDPTKVYTKRDYEYVVAETHAVTAEIVQYLQSIGESLSKLQLMLRAPAEGMNIISNEQALETGIAVLDEETGRVIEPGARPQRVSSL